MEVKLFRIITGEEIIAEVVSENETTITVRNGLMVIPTAHNIGFAPWSTVVSREEPELEVSRAHIVYTAEVEHNVKEKYDLFLFHYLRQKYPQKLYY